MDLIIILPAVAVYFGALVAMHGHIVPVKDPLAHFIGIVPYLDLLEIGAAVKRPFSNGLNIFGQL